MYPAWYKRNARSGNSTISEKRIYKLGWESLLRIHKWKFCKRFIFFEEIIVNIFPAIDLKDNKCVRLTKGKDDTTIIFNEDPVSQASYFEQMGCKRLHLIDLDSAFGRRGINSGTIKKIRKAISIPIQLGGGIRNEEDVKFFFDINIDYLILGSFSATEPERVITLSKSYPEKIYVSVDVLSNKVMIKGWEQKTSLKSKDVYEKYKDTNIRGYILTDIENDGMLNGLNIKLISENLKLTKKRLIVGGGLTNYEDIKNLLAINSKNLEGVISGKSYYVGNINLKIAQEIINKNA